MALGPLDQMKNVPETEGDLDKYQGNHRHMLQNEQNIRGFLDGPKSDPMKRVTLKSVRPGENQDEEDDLAGPEGPADNEVKASANSVAVTLHGVYESKIK